MFEHRADHLPSDFLEVRTERVGLISKTEVEVGILLLPLFELVVFVAFPGLAGQFLRGFSALGLPNGIHEGCFREEWQWGAQAPQIELQQFAQAALCFGYFAEAPGSILANKITVLRAR